MVLDHGENDHVLVFSGLPLVKREPVRSGTQLRVYPNGCLDCDLTFEDTEDLLDHFRGHPHNYIEGQSPIECPINTCNLKFSSRGRLLAHLRLGKHNQPCPTCGKKLNRVSSYYHF